MELSNMELEAAIGTKFRKLWKHYFLQSVLATALFSILVVILGREKMVLISAMGATTFIVFAMPNAVSAKRRNVIGGHLIGLASGAIFYFITLPYFLGYPLAVGIAIFFMVALDVEHPPARMSLLSLKID
jgi:CBS-domain-containing membrane protein